MSALRNPCWTVKCKLASFADRAVCIATSNAANTKSPNMMRTVSDNRATHPRLLRQTRAARAPVCAFDSVSIHFYFAAGGGFAPVTKGGRGRNRKKIHLGLNMCRSKTFFTTEDTGVSQSSQGNPLRVGSGQWG